MIALVLSLRSDQHPWWIESRSSRDNPKADWHLWADPRPDGLPPSNWPSVFGGSAWTWHGGWEQYLLHGVLTSQPDLDLHEPEVQDALLDVVRFWLRRGVDGFRPDTINFRFADRCPRDNPSLPRELRNDSVAPSVTTCNHPLHLFSGPAREPRLFAPLPGRTPARRGGRGRGGRRATRPRDHGQHTSGGDKVEMCYPFALLQPTRATALPLAASFDRLPRAAPDPWPCWSHSNHDTVRPVSR